MTTESPVLELKKQRMEAFRDVVTRFTLELTHILYYDIDLIGSLTGIPLPQCLSEAMKITKNVVDEFEDVLDREFEIEKHLTDFFPVK
jgi:hypothetical protein